MGIPDGSSFSWIATVVGWLGTVGAALGLAIWNARGAQARLEAQITDEVDTLRRETGESLIAMREKVSQVELWNRDNLVRQTDFQKAMDGFNARLEKLSVDITQNQKDISQKIDRILAR